MLSWDKGLIPVAIVRGARKGDGRTLYLNDKRESPAGSVSEVELMDGQLQCLPDPTHRTVAYCAGQSGSGKSTWMSNYVAEFSTQHPKSPIFILSRLAEDKAYEGIPNVERIPLDEAFVESPLVMTDFPEGCFVLFDDVDTLDSISKKLLDCVLLLQRDILETGRHRMIHVGITSHNLCDGRKTRTILNEAHMITLFPHGGSLNQLRYVLKTYAGFDKHQIQHFMDLPSRWVTFY
ncbi:MAG: hypothetical protein Q7U97_12170, partial [Rhodocyclaceae bacterium]|nr:hypothetical protein [Rhodocyclaceae bacterium]